MARGIGGQYPTVSLFLTEADIRRLLREGWIAQTKMDGKRCEIHVEPCPRYFTRQGSKHTKPPPHEIGERLLEIFPTGWVLDAELLDNTLYLFDLLVDETGLLTNKIGFIERFERIPKNFIDPKIKILPLLKTFEACKKVMLSDDPKIEGLVFKHKTSKDPTAIMRARKKDGRLS